MRPYGALHVAARRGRDDRTGSADGTSLMVARCRAWRGRWAGDGSVCDAGRAITSARAPTSSTLPLTVRLLVLQGGAPWRSAAGRTAEPEPDEVLWHDPPVESELVVAVIDEAYIDREWPSWNLARTGLILDGEATVPWAAAPFSLLGTARRRPATPRPVSVRSAHTTRSGSGPAPGDRLPTAQRDALVPGGRRRRHRPEQRDLLQQPRHGHRAHRAVSRGCLSGAARPAGVPPCAGSPSDPAGRARARGFLALGSRLHDA